MKIGILICTYNRPEYLKKCLESLKYVSNSNELVFLIVDDASTNQETLKLLHKSGYTLILKKSNTSIKDCMFIGCNFLFLTEKVDYVVNLDGDAIVREDFLDVLLGLNKRFPDNIITGFNCTTKNRDGSVRHEILLAGEGFNTKKSVGGINMFFDIKKYLRFIKPALLECLKNGGNWDHKACINSYSAGYPIICSVPSVVQHIGFISSMGHTSGSEPPDVADDFLFSTQVDNDETKFQPDFSILKHLDMEDVTLVGADCVDINRLIRAANNCCDNINFGAVKLFSSIPSSDNRVIQIKHFENKSDYSVFMMKDLAPYIQTRFLLVIQYDGYVLSADAWRNEWYGYDYIGAPWEWYDDGMNVGNGGFSFRSKRLMDLVASDDAIVPVNEPSVTQHKEEDHCICRIYRKYLEREYEIRFAPIEEARKFSIEGWKSKNKTWTTEFGFHGNGLTNVKTHLNGSVTNRV